MLFDYDGIKLETNNRKMVVKFPNTQKLSYTLLNNPWVKEDISREIRKYFEMNKNENAAHQNLWDTGLKSMFPPYEIRKRTK